MVLQQAFWLMVHRHNLNNRRQLSWGFHRSTRFLQTEVWLKKRVGWGHNIMTYSSVWGSQKQWTWSAPSWAFVRKTGSNMVEPWLVFGQVRNKRKLIVFLIAIKKNPTPLTATSSLLLQFESCSMSAERKQDCLNNQQTNSILLW